MQTKSSMMKPQFSIVLAIGFLIVSLLVLPVSLQAASTTLVINEVMYDQTGSDETQEFVEIYVAGGGFDVQGYVLDDQDTHSITFPSFTPNTGEYIVVHTQPGTNDLTGPVYNLYMGFNSPIWNDTGDDVLLKDSSGTGIDYIAYEGGGAINPPPPELSWSGTSPSNSGTEGIGISLISNGVDGDTGDGWEKSGTTTTYGPTTEGADNNQDPTAVTLSSFTAHPTASQASFSHRQWLALAVRLVSGGGAIARRLLGR